jgi:hypothetical protein
MKQKVTILSVQAVFGEDSSPDLSSKGSNIIDRDNHLYPYRWHVMNYENNHAWWNIINLEGSGHKELEGGTAALTWKNWGRIQ